MKRFVLVLIIAILGSGFFPRGVDAGNIEAQILQFKLNRYYFSVGKESLVFPGHHFAIVRGKDTVVVGTIEESYSGVSIGSGSLPKDGRRNFEKYKAVVQSAETEPMTFFRVGAFASQFCISDSLLSIWGGVPDSNGRVSGEDRFIVGQDTVVVTTSDDSLALFDKLDRHLIDAVVFVGSSRSRPNYQVYSAPAPFSAALLANPLHEVTRGGIFTTSLYYRFDPTRVQSSLTRPCDPVGSFRYGDSVRIRPYPYDPGRGKELYRQIGTKPEMVRISSGESLKPVAMYLGDVLAREQCRTEIVPDTSGEPVDLILTYTKPGEGVKEAIDLLLTRFRTERGQEAALPDVLKRLNEIRAGLDSTGQVAAADSATYRATIEQLKSQADQILIHEMGCFPLFRPMYTLVTRNDVSGIGLTERGEISISDPKWIILPEPAAREQR